MLSSRALLEWLASSSLPAATSQRSRPSCHVSINIGRFEISAPRTGRVWAQHSNGKNVLRGRQACKQAVSETRAEAFTHLWPGPPSVCVSTPSLPPCIRRRLRRPRRVAGVRSASAVVGQRTKAWFGTISRPQVSWSTSTGTGTLLVRQLHPAM